MRAGSFQNRPAFLFPFDIINSDSVSPHPAFGHFLPQGEGIVAHQEESILIAQEYSCLAGMIFFCKRRCERGIPVTI